MLGTFRLIAIGGSSGSRKAIAEVLQDIPTTIDAAFLIVVHSAFDDPTMFDVALSKKTKLKVQKAEHNQAITSGNVYIAQPNKHLFVSEGTIKFSKDPRENLFRPAIDVLFRSAGVAYKNKCIGVLMSGRLYDGSSGLEAIKKCGGLALVQDPKSTTFSDMPSHALEKVDVDYSLSPEKIGKRLQQLVSEPLPAKKTIPKHILRENEIVNTIGSNISLENILGRQVPISCPSCSGPLWEMERTKIKRFRCHVGHSFTEEALLKSQNEALEETLWVSLRTLEEKRMLLERMSQGYSKNQKSTMSRSYRDKIEEVSKHINNLKQILQLTDP